MVSKKKESEPVKVEKPSFLKTLSLLEFSEQLGMEETEVLSKVSNGVIIAIQTGGKGKPITYRFLESEVNRYKTWVEEVVAAAKRKADEKEAEAAGRKVIEIYERHGDEITKIITVNWAPDFPKMDFDSLIDAIGFSLKKDLNHLKTAEIVHDGFVYTRFKKLSHLEYVPVLVESKKSKEKVQWFISEIVFDFPKPIVCPIDEKKLSLTE